MQTIQFEDFIYATPEKLWAVLWSDDTYRLWTRVFAEGSYAQTDWQEGSKVLFLDGAGSGMVSRIKKKEEPFTMVFEHIGFVKDNTEDTTSPEVRQWAGATESYTLKPMQHGTQLTVALQVAAEWKEFFEKTWPLAVQKIKQLAEEKN